MDAIKNSLKSVKSVFEGVPFLKVMLTAGVYIFAGGGLLWLISAFLPVIYGAYFIKTLLASFGRVAIFVGLGFAAVKSEDLFVLITSAAISVGALIAALVEVIAYGYSNFELWLYFLLFGGVAALVLIFGDKFKEMKAAAQQRAQERAVQQAAAQQAAAQQAAAQAAAAQQVQLIECPNCKGPVPINAKFCPNCGAPNPALQQQAPPVAPTPPPAAPAAPAPVAPAPEAPPAAPTPAQEAPPAAPAQEAPPAAPAPETKACSACGAQIPASSAFCGQCGAKQ